MRQYLWFNYCSPFSALRTCLCPLVQSHIYFCSCVGKQTTSWKCLWCIYLHQMCAKSLETFCVWPYYHIFVANIQSLHLIEACTWLKKELLSQLINYNTPSSMHYGPAVSLTIKTPCFIVYIVMSRKWSWKAVILQKQNEISHLTGMAFSTFISLKTTTSQHIFAFIIPVILWQKWTLCSNCWQQHNSTALITNKEMYTNKQTVLPMTNKNCVGNHY